MKCSYCHDGPELLMIYDHQIYCLSCLAKRFPNLGKMIWQYLDEFKHMKAISEGEDS